MRPHVWFGSASSKKWLVLGVFLVAAAMMAGVVGLSSAAAHRSGQAAGSNLRIAITGAPDPFDPALLGDNRSIELAQNVYEGVLGVNNKAQIVPALASTWSRSANGLVYTFNLRHGLQFENGDPITASDFVYTFNRSLSPKTAAGASFFLADIKGADAVLNGKAKAASGIKAIGKYTLQVTLAHKAGYFAAEISRWPAWVVDSEGDRPVRQELDHTASQRRLGRVPAHGPSWRPAIHVHCEPELLPGRTERQTGVGVCRSRLDGRGRPLSGRRVRRCRRAVSRCDPSGQVEPDPEGPVSQHTDRANGLA